MMQGGDQTADAVKLPSKFSSFLSGMLETYVFGFAVAKHNTFLFTNYRRFFPK